MNMLKHVVTALKRNKIRNLMITLIMFVIMAISCVALSIHTTANQIRDEQKQKYGSRAYIDISEKKLKEMSSSGSLNMPALSNDVLLKLAESKTIKEAFVESSFMANGTDLKLPKKEEPQGSSGMMSSTVIGSDGNGEAYAAPDFYVRSYKLEQEATFYEKQNKKLVDGAYPKAKDECLISSALATENNLKVGDEITITSSNFDKSSTTPSSMKLNITGFYQPMPTSDDQMSYMFSQEEIYILNETALASEYGNQLYVDASYYLRSPDDLPAFQAEAKELGLSEDYDVKTDTNSYESVIAPIDGIAQVAMVFLVIVLLLGGSLLTLLTFFNIRERNYEIGILRALGMKKRSVIAQMILEPWCLAAFAFCIGYGAGITCAQPISDQLLEQQLQKKESNQGSGMVIMSSTSTAMFQGENTPIEDMKVQFNVLVFLQLCGVAGILILLSGGISACYIVRYEPMQILSERR